MKFSVLLPTRNRLEYLRYAVETVRRQDHSDWEIIISDNCSEENILAYVDSLSDPRIKYFRTETFVPVTANWNNALDQSTGDYVVMLGDDDGLLPGYFSSLEHAFQTYPDPDFVYTSAYFYAYPGVIPAEPHGFLRRDRNRVLVEAEPFWLDAERALRICRGYLDFRMPVASNMQFSLISRRKIIEFCNKGPFFRSPYPDFYATPSLFLTSNRILIYPRPMVIVGISPKSYGFYHFNNKSEDGVKFLNNQQSNIEPWLLQSIMLPGNSYNDSWLLAMEAMRINFGQQFDVRPNYKRYRFLQILNVYKRYYFDRSLSREDLYQLRKKMRFFEKLVYGVGLPIAFKLIGLISENSRTKLIEKLRVVIGQHGIHKDSDPSPRFRNLLEVFDAQELKRIHPK